MKLEEVTPDKTAELVALLEAGKIDRKKLMAMNQLPKMGAIDHVLADGRATWGKTRTADD